MSNEERNSHKKDDNLCEEKPAIDSKMAIRNIIKNYKLLESSIVSQLNFGYEKHWTTTGNHREMIWKSIFEQMIPAKFSVAQGVFIIDSKKNISREADLAIFDETYTPYIFKYGELKFLPIEAVAAVIECKSGNLNPKVLKNWSDSIDKLETGINAITRLNGHIDFGEFADEKTDKDGKKHTLKYTQTSTRPIKILCHMSESDKAQEHFDLTIRANNGNLKIYESNNFQQLSNIYKELNHHKPLETKKDIAKLFGKDIKFSDYAVDYQVVKKDSEEIQVQGEVTLMSLMFKLNQILMLINNPIFFPHRAYVDMFKDGLKALIESEKSENSTEGEATDGIKNS